MNTFFRSELHLAARRRIAARRRRNRTLAVIVLAGALIASGVALAATQLGSPAPPQVTADFGSYATGLGFHPVPGKAVLVAQDGAISLYATTNAEGTACVTITAPWKTGPDHDDGGTCIRQADESKPILAGFVGGNTPPSGPAVFVIAGRVLVAGAVSVSFPTADGTPISAPLGPGGYFVTTVGSMGCDSPTGVWKPVFNALDAAGSTRASTAIELAESPTPATCGWPFGLHAELGPRP
jgi:hypothetical protein